MAIPVKGLFLKALAVPLLSLAAFCAFGEPARAAASIQNSSLTVTADLQRGSYEIFAKGLQSPVLEARIAAEIDHHWIYSDGYPRHVVGESAFQDPLGAGSQLTITFSGLRQQPDLVCVLRLYKGRAYGTLQVKVVNHSPKTVSVQSIREVEAIGDRLVNLGASEASDRFMFESYSEDPTIRIGGLDQAPNGVYFGVRDGLIFNHRSRQSLLLAALTENRFMTALHLTVEQPPMGASMIGSFTVDSTGTTEAVLRRDDIAPDQRVWLSLPVAPGRELNSEPLMFAAGPHYHAQLEAYGAAVRQLHHARVSSTPPMGWWSWTAFYRGVDEEEVLRNARWLARHLKSLGFDYLHIDEGYDYARGEYTTANAAQFPSGMRKVAYRITRMGLKLGLWTAPFEVSARASVYKHHKDWLVHDARGRPIRIGYLRGKVDPLYVMDVTNPGAQKYLRMTYRTLTREWGVRYIKLDFMDSSAIEGYYHRPHTTALEAERMGLKIIRDAVGNGVLLDKDGSPMLAPVGLVDEGRITPDTGHSFAASMGADPNIAARFYMNGNFYSSDPDAFNLLPESAPGRTTGKQNPRLTLDEAQVQIVLAALAGGMYEIGDDLPTLASLPRRLALVRNKDLLRMVGLHRAATPVDLMSFPYQDRMPSEYFLREDARQSMLAVFNWTTLPRTHLIDLSSLGLAQGHPYQAYDVLNADKPVKIRDGRLLISRQAVHSVRLIKIVDTSVLASAPSVSMDAPASAQTGTSVHFQARADLNGVPDTNFHLLHNRRYENPVGR